MVEEPRPNSWRRPIVGVMGSGTEAHLDLAEPLGTWLAGLGVHLLTGGGGGVMGAVSRAFHATPGREGSVIGVLPSAATPGEAPPGYPNPWVEIPICTHLSSVGAQGMATGSRNHINVLTSDVIVALPGSEGTASEIRLALRYGRPLIAWARSPTEAAALPDGVARALSLDDVKAFVEPLVEM